MLFVDYMYAHFDNFKLIFACSKGSQVENFIEDITERYTAKNMKLFFSTLNKSKLSQRLKSLKFMSLQKAILHLYASVFFMIYRMIMLANILEVLLFFNIMVGKA